jgi:hypothetical protein
MEIIIILFLFVFTIILYSQNDTPKINKKLKNINLFLEVFESNNTTMFLVYEEDNNKFVCQATSEKELHSKLYKIYHGLPVFLRKDIEIVCISFETLK